MILLIFVFACYGMTLILVYGKIFDGIRPSHHFWHCPMCIGFWVGAIFAPMTLMLFDPIPGFWSEEWWLFLVRSAIVALLGGCVSSGTSYALTMLFGDCGLRINNGDKED